MDRFQEMQVFVWIAEHGSFTQAAEDLRIPRAIVTNLIKRMEKRIDTRLLEELSDHHAVNYLSSSTGRAVPLEFTVAGEVKSVQLS